jgi:hypothetical protein
MEKTIGTISAELQGWLEAQHVFFVATAPLAADGHVNCSPKGCDSFRVLNEREVAYLDYTGSGIETIAHLQENGRIVIMFCAFEGPPKIVRLHGVGSVVYPSDEAFDELSKRFPNSSGMRAFIRLKLTRVATTCGFGVPLMEFAGERDTLTKWCQTKGPEGLAAYREEKNAVSIDALSGYRSREKKAASNQGLNE